MRILWGAFTFQRKKYPSSPGNVSITLNKIKVTLPIWVVLVFLGPGHQRVLNWNGIEVICFIYLRTSRDNHLGNDNLYIYILNAKSYILWVYVCINMFKNTNKDAIRMNYGIFRNIGQLNKSMEFS